MTSRTALVTGGNRGIGLAIAEGLAAKDIRVIIGARDLAAGQEAAEKVGGDAIQLDMADPASVFDAVYEAGRNVDIVINNAGVLFDERLIDDPKGFETSMAVMVHGPYHLIRALAPNMVERGWGRIINVSSEWGSFADGLGGPNAYGVAKAALNALTLRLSRELPPSVKINAMCPGWVRTRMGGPGATRSPEEGADTALWLATLPEDGPTGGFFRDRKPIAW